MPSIEVNSLPSVPPYTNVGSDFVHLALATYPTHGDAQAYVNEVHSQFYDEFSTNLKNNFVGDVRNSDGNLHYKPLTYHLFGHYDVAFISLITNSKFGHRPFWSPKFTGSHANSFQIFTGVCTDLSMDGHFNLYDTFKEISDNQYDFVGICNLKLSNGLLIGNGQRYLDAVMRSVKAKVEDESGCSFLIIQSFSWFEINLIVFGEKPESVINVISSLRSMRVGDLKYEEPNDNGDQANLKREVQKLMKDSFYYSRLCSNSVEKNQNLINNLIENAHLFADTHSYIGVRFDAMISKNHDFSKVILNTQTEFQTKPGHSAFMVAELDKIGIFDTKEAHALTGKSDYQILESNPALFSNNQKLFQAVFDTKNSGLKRHIRNFKTRPYFELPKREKGKIDVEFLDSIPKSLKSLIYGPDILAQVHLWLKTLKVSRQIREKILKIFFNYNFGISDDVIYTYFVDFTLFMERLTDLLQLEYNYFRGCKDSNGKLELPKPVDELEKILMHYIDAFDEAYRIRMMNCYEFEDIYDFELDFNSSTQQLLSTYNMVAQKMSELFFKPAKGHIIRLHSQNTNSNDISINCSINHLTSPEFIFFTLTKEILNSATSTGGQGSFLYESIEATILKHSITSLDIGILLDDGVLDINYLIYDVYRFIYGCNYDVRLLEHWIWAFSLQNTSMYNSRGLIEEKFFRAKLLEVLCIFRLVGVGQLPECPIPELYNFWTRYFAHYKKIVDLIFDDNAIAYIFKDHFSQSLSGHRSVKILVHSGLIFQHGNPSGISVQGVDGGLSLLSEDRFVAVSKDASPAPSTVVNILFFEQRINIFGQIISLIGKELRAGRPVLYDPSKLGNEESAINETLFLSVLLNAYLHLIYDANGRQINLLRRSFESGEPDLDFLHPHDTNGLYKIDSFGGVFFTSDHGRHEYYKIRNAILQSIWHFATVVKKKFLIEQLSAKPL